MQRFAIIGLGRFGSRLALNLAAAGQEVIAIDEDERLIEEMRDRVTLAVALDATDELALRLQGIDRVDAAIVGIGEDFEANCLATVTLKQIGVKKVISRAMTPISARILRGIGADDVVAPEDESADRWADKLVSPQFLSHYELDEGHAIVEVRTPSRWTGQTLAELNLRARYGLNVVAIKHADEAAQGKEPRHRLQLPTPDRPLRSEDIMIIMGKDEDLAKLRE
jgi:trk system potassium uptake protein TrkA